MTPFQRFQPDLIVEVTSTCDRKCPGCYAPNVVTTQDALQLFTEKPHWFLSRTVLKEALHQVLLSNDLSARIISVRGGEPTRHPRLFELLETIREFTRGTIYLETHGRWVLSDDDDTPLFDAIANHKIVVKISFDRMHGLSPTALQEITTSLNERGVQWCVAITESGDADFARSRSRCDWVEDHQIFFQEKARTADGLVRPTIAVISVDGKVSAGVSVRSDFRPSEFLDVNQAKIQAKIQNRAHQ